MLTELRQALNMLWTRIRRAEGWLYGVSQSPMIIEEGTETQGIITWTYRKWSDGRAECWGKTTPKTYTHTTASGYGYYTSEVQTLPTGLFESVEVGFGDRLQGEGSTPSNTLISINVNRLNTTEISYWIQSASSGSQSLAIALYIRGNWKTPINTSTSLNGNYYTDDVWNYDYLINKPLINGQLVNGNKTSTELGLADKVDVDYLRNRIQAITTEGGEPNAIDSISVNGAAVTPDVNKNVALIIPHITASTTEPTVGDGENGDIWFVYEEE